MLCHSMSLYLSYLATFNTVTSAKKYNYFCALTWTTFLTVKHSMHDSFLCWLFTESAMFVSRVGHHKNPASRWTRDFWSKSILLIPVDNFVVFCRFDECFEF